MPEHENVDLVRMSGNIERLLAIQEVQNKNQEEMKLSIDRLEQTVLIGNGKPSLAQKVHDHDEFIRKHEDDSRHKQSILNSIRIMFVGSILSAVFSIVVNFIKYFTK